MTGKNEPQLLDDLMADYDRERIAEIDRWETNKPQWVKDKLAAERKREIELGIRDEDGNLVSHDPDDEDPFDTEDGDYDDNGEEDEE
jgi:hypothetical protein